MVDAESVDQQSRSVVQRAVGVEPAAHDGGHQDRPAALLPHPCHQCLEVRAVRRLVRRLVVVGELDQDEVAVADQRLDRGPQLRVPQIRDRTLAGVGVVGDRDALAQVLRQLLAPAGVRLGGLVADGGVADEEDLPDVPGGGDPDVGQRRRGAAERQVQSGGTRPRRSVRPRGCGRRRVKLRATRAPAGAAVSGSRARRVSAVTLVLDAASPPRTTFTS